jgi:hypothetical protein
MSQPETGEGQKNEAEQRRRWELYSEHKKQAWQDIQSSTSSFEQNLLAVSSAALGVSLAFIKDIVSLKQAVSLKLLYTSWICFSVCIVLTVFSFRLSVAAQTKYLDYLWAYYIEGKQQFFNKKSIYSKTLAISIWIAAALFLAGLIFTVVFCIKNVARRP